MNNDYIDTSERIYCTRLSSEKADAEESVTRQRMYIHSNPSEEADHYPQSSPSSRARKSSSSSPPEEDEELSSESSSFMSSSSLTTLPTALGGVAELVLLSSSSSSTMSSAVIASLSFELPERSAANFLRFASGERRLSESLAVPDSEGVMLRSRLRFLFAGVEDALLRGFIV